MLLWELKYFVVQGNPQSAFAYLQLTYTCERVRVFFLLLRQGRICSPLAHYGKKGPLEKCPFLDLMEGGGSNCFSMAGDGSLFCILFRPFGDRKPLFALLSYVNRFKLLFVEKWYVNHPLQFVPWQARPAAFHPLLFRRKRSHGFSGHISGLTILSTVSSSADRGER